MVYPSPLLTTTSLHYRAPHTGHPPLCLHDRRPVHCARLRAHRRRLPTTTLPLFGLGRGHGLGHWERHPPTSSHCSMITNLYKIYKTYQFCAKTYLSIHQHFDYIGGYAQRAPQRSEPRPTLTGRLSGRRTLRQLRGRSDHSVAAGYLPTYPLPLRGLRPPTTDYLPTHYRFAASGRQLPTYLPSASRPPAAKLPTYKMSLPE